MSRRVTRTAIVPGGTRYVAIASRSLAGWNSASVSAAALSRATRVEDKRTGAPDAGFPFSTRASSGAPSASSCAPTCTESAARDRNEDAPDASDASGAPNRPSTSVGENPRLPAASGSDAPPRSSASVQCAFGRASASVPRTDSAAIAAAIADARSPEMSRNCPRSGPASTAAALAARPPTNTAHRGAPHADQNRISPSRAHATATSDCSPVSEYGSRFGYEPSIDETPPETLFPETVFPVFPEETRFRHQSAETIGEPAVRSTRMAGAAAPSASSASSEDARSAAPAGMTYTPPPRVPHSNRGPSASEEQQGGLNSSEVMRACSPSYQGSILLKRARAFFSSASDARSAPSDVPARATRSARNNRWCLVPSSEACAAAWNTRVAGGSPGRAAASDVHAAATSSRRPSRARGARPAAPEASSSLAKAPEGGSLEARAEPPAAGELVDELRRTSPPGSLLRERTARTFSTANRGMSRGGRSSSSSSSSVSESALRCIDPRPTVSSAAPSAEDSTPKSPGTTPSLGVAIFPVARETRVGECSMRRSSLSLTRRSKFVTETLPR